METSTPSSRALRTGLRLGLILLALHSALVPVLILLRGFWPGAGALQRLLDAPVNDLSYWAGNRLVPLAWWLQAHTSLSVGQVVLICEAAVHVACGGVLYFSLAFLLGAIGSRASDLFGRKRAPPSLPQRVP